MPPRGSVIIPTRYLAGLYRVPPETWESKILGWERGSGPMGASYAPMFRALNREIEHPGGGHLVLDVETYGFADTPSNNAIVENSRRALDIFAQRWRHEFPTILQSFPDGSNGHEPSTFEGHLLRGGFHAMVEDRNGVVRLLGYHASKWETPDARAAHLELLTIIAEARHGLPREAARLLDFRSGDCLAPHSSYKAVRKGLLKAADHYLRLCGS